MRKRRREKKYFPVNQKGKERKRKTERRTIRKKE